MPDGQLSSLLMSLKLNSTDAKDIMTLAKTSNYQLACQKHFDITHPGHLEMDLKIVSFVRHYIIIVCGEAKKNEVLMSGVSLLLQSDSVANHPNQWFQASINYHKLKSGKSLTEAATSMSETFTAAVKTEGGEAMDVAK